MRDEMFADDDPDLCTSKEKVQDRAVQMLDDLACRIADGDVEVNQIKIGPNNPQNAYFKDQVRVLEVRYNE